MSKITILLAAILALFPSITYLADLRYRIDPSLQHAVCRNFLCSDELLSESADRLAGGNLQDQTTALAILQERLRRNVALPDRWCDVGDALLSAGRQDEAKFYFGRALAIGPQSTIVLWRAAQFYRQIKEPGTGEEYLGKILAASPQYKEIYFGIYWSGGGDVVETLEHGIPPHTRLGQDYFRYLLIHGTAPANLARAWHWLQSHSQPDDELAGDYVEFLSRNGQLALAADTWKSTAGRHDTSWPDTNLVFNGGFESEPLQRGFDWRFSPSPGVQIRRDSSVAFSGSSSLLITFDGQSNIDFNSVAQDVVVQPGRYHFKAWLRTMDLTTDQGIGFHLIDSSGRIHFQTVRVTGTHDWTPLDVDFTISSPVRLLRIEVVRQPSWKFDNKIGGKVWIDGVSLVRS